MPASRRELRSAFFHLPDGAKTEPLAFLNFGRTNLMTSPRMESCGRERSSSTQNLCAIFAEKMNFRLSNCCMRWGLIRQGRTSGAARSLIHHGVGHLSWTLPRSANRHAAKWTDNHDFEFHAMMVELLSKGMKESAALKELANDPTKWKRFPQPASVRSETPAESRRFQNFKSRWIRIIKKTARPGGLLRSAVGSYPVKGSDTDKAKWNQRLMTLLQF
jgi:hypothetical protein